MLFASPGFMLPARSVFVAAKAYYNCNQAMVITNSYFTSGTKNLANKNNVVLWDRENLSEAIDTYL